MRNSWLRIALSLFISTSVSAAPQVRIQPSFILGLWSFVSTETGHLTSQAVQEAYEKSKFHTPENDRHLAEIGEIILENFREGYYPFHGAAEGREEQSWDVTAHFDYQAARSQTLEEFRTRTQGVIPTVKHQQLFQALKTLEPVYDQLIWKPNLAQLNKDQMRLESVMKKADVQNVIQSLIQFYHANWNDAVPFTIMIVPVPAIKGPTHATVICDTGLLQILRNEKNIDSRFGVLVHEIGHSLYSTESPEFQKEMADWFLKSTVPTAKIAYKNWEEVLSTIIGNGWAYEKAAGKPDSDEWYNNKEYNDLSKALYPLAKTYLESKKPLDEDFARTAIDTFQKLFPDSARRYRRLLRKVLVVTDGSFGDKLLVKKQLMADRRWIKQYGFASPMSEKETVKAVADRGTQGALILLINPEHQSELDQFTPLAPEIKILRTLLKSETGYATAIDPKGRLTIIIQAKDLADISKALHKIVPDEAASEGPRFYPN